MKDKILIAGGSGYVGQHLTRMLEEEGFEVTCLGRNKNPSHHKNYLCWDYQTPKEEIDRALQDHPILINLCGATLAGKRWTKKYKDVLLNSRIQPSKALVERIIQLQVIPKMFIQSSAIGYYPLNGLCEAHQEDEAPGSSFLSALCKQWENTTIPLEEKKISVVKLRIAPVFNPGSAVFETWAKPFRYGLGAVVGSGQQYFPWIHIEDLGRIVLWSIKNNKHGVYNAAGPSLIQHREVARALAKHLHKPMWLPAVPSFMLQLIYGEAAMLITEGDPVSSKKIQQEGFTFRYGWIEDCFRKKG